MCRAVKPNIQVFRAKFSEITSAAVFRALNSIATPDIRQSQAVDVRSELDLRIGKCHIGRENRAELNSNGMYF